MKSRVLAILLVVALLVTVAVFSVQAESTGLSDDQLTAAETLNAVHTAAEAYDFSTAPTTCPVCGDGVEWVAITEETADNLADESYNGATHFYLSESITHQVVANTASTFCLHLNGNDITYTASNKAAILVGKSGGVDGLTMNIMGAGEVIGKGLGVSSGGINWKAGGALEVWGTTVNLYGGTYKCNATRAMPVVSTFVAADSIINMYEGATIDGSNKTGAGITPVTSCVYILGATHEFNMFGGTITGGQATEGGENIKALDGTINLAGGTVDGGVYIAEEANINIYKSAQVASTNGGIDLTDGAKLGLGELTTAAVYVTAADGTAITDSLADAQAAYSTGCIRAADTKLAVAVKDGKLAIDSVYDAAVAMQSTDSTTGIFDAANGADVSAVCPHCGTVATWKALNSSNAGEVGGTGNTHYYLQEDITKTDGVIVLLSTESNPAVCLHLNKKNLDFAPTGSKLSAIDVKAGNTMTIMGDGDVKGTGSTSTGGALTVRGTVNLFGGTWMSTRSGTSYYAIMFNGSNRVLNIYDGTIVQRPSTTANSGCIQFPSNATNATLNMYGGTIQNGKTASGGNIWVNSINATLNISGGLITSGVSTGYGGNIYVKGKGASNEAVINISGTAQITNGDAQGNTGGGIYMSSYADLVMTGGTVSGNEAVSGGNFAFNAGSNNVTISGGTISDGTSDDYGGNIYISSGSATVEIEGGTISGGTANAGGSIYGVGKLNITGGIITGGTATANGGCINISAGTLTISGGQIGIDKDGNAAGGTATGNGGNLYLASSTAATISGDAVIANGSAVRGGNIGFGNSAQLTINADAEDATVVPTISGGTATEYGGNIFATGAFTMNAGNVQGGYAAEEGGSMYFMNWDNTADVNIAINGGVIDGKPYETAGVNNGGHGGLIYAYTNPDQASGTGLTLTLKDVTLTNGKIDTAYNGSAVYMSGSTLILDGDTQIDDSNNDIPVYVTGTSSLTVNAGFTGEVRVYASLADGTTYGDQLVSSGTGVYSCTGEYTGTVRLLNITGACAIGDTSTGTLWVAGVALCKDGVVVDGALTAADAVAKFASGNYDFIRSYTDETTFELTDEAVTYVIDLDGRDITVNAAEGVTGVVFAGLDTNATTSAASGAVATLGEGVINGVQYNNNGTIYIGLESEDTVAYHALKMDITGVSLRTTTGGIYYWASVKCDDTLAAELDSFGIIFGINEAAPAGIGEDLTMFSEITEDILTDGTEMTGAIMNNVLEAGRTDPTNDAAGAMKIWGVPYVTITYTDADGYEQTAEILAGEAQSAHMSIYDVVSKLDAYIGTLEDTDATKTTYLNLMTEKFDWEGYAFTDEDWLAVKASLDAKKAALNTETAE